jgi:hypothetical protein
MKKTIFFTALFVAGCSSVTTNVLEETVGVGPEDNAILCVELVVPGRWTGTIVKVKRLEFPKDFDTSSLTAKDLDELENQLCN